MSVHPLFSQHPPVGSGGTRLSPAVDVAVSQMDWLKDSDALTIAMARLYAETIDSAGGDKEPPPVDTSPELLVAMITALRTDLDRLKLIDKVGRELRSVVQLLYSRQDLVMEAKKKKTSLAALRESRNLA